MLTLFKSKRIDKKKLLLLLLKDYNFLVEVLFTHLNLKGLLGNCLKNNGHFDHVF